MSDYLQQLAEYWIYWLVLTFMCFIYSLPFICIALLAYAIGEKL